MILRIARVGQAAEEIDFPDLADGDGRVELERAILVIQKEWEIRRKRAKGKTNSSDDERHSRWLKGTCYRLILHCESTGLREHILHRMANFKRYSKNDNIFSVYLMGIFAEDKYNFTTAMRRRFSKELFYAFRHYVPWQFVNGFLNQVQDIDTIQDISRIEEGFWDWIIPQRASSFDRDSARGQYPELINRQIRDIQKGLAMNFERIGIERAKSVIDHIFDRDALSADDVKDLDRLVEEDPLDRMKGKYCGD